ncbi:MAG: GNAT family N-acetyltransferase [Phycisphaerales bacterium]
MPTFRSATPGDAPAMALLRDSSGWGGGAPEETIRRYLAGQHHPQQAQTPRVAILAFAGGELIGFIAGHRTTRLGCDGELQWMLVAPAHRGGETATGLLRELMVWFSENGIGNVCINVEPGNARARSFYRRHGARDHGSHWMIWAVVALHPPSPQNE